MPCRRLAIPSILLLSCQSLEVDSWIQKSRVSPPTRLTVPPPWIADIRGGAGGEEDIEIIEIEAVVTEENLPQEPVEETPESTDVKQENVESAPPPSVQEEEEEDQAAALNEGDSSVDNLDHEKDDAKSDEEIVNETSDETETTTQTETDTKDVAPEEEQSTTDDEEDLLKETEARALAAQLRLHGKELHDEGKWDEAADTFREASTILEEQLDAEEELATCRLHEALCRLKQMDYDACAEACSLVLETETVPAAIQARAHHRRAKAKLGLGDVSGALQDARSAAFLGDRKAVALYGRLMRETSSSTLDSNDSGGDGSASSPALLNDLFQGRNPFMPDNNDGASSALMESLLSKSGGPTSTGSSGGNPLGALGDMTSLLGIGKKKGNKGGSSLAKSVLKSLSKRLEDESTQDMICTYLQNTDTPQLQQMASLAGVPLTEPQASKLVKFCHSVTPKGIRKSIKTSKTLWYVVSVIRKTFQIIQKYKPIIVLWVLLSWIKSALLRPIPISKKAAKIAAGKGTT